MRSWVWLSPPHPPISVEAKPRKIRSWGVVEVSCVKRAKGASFCQVERTRPVVRLKP